MSGMTQALIEMVLIVVENVTSEDILLYICYIIIIIIIIFYCTFIVPPFWYVFPPIEDVINVIGHVKVEVKPPL